MSEPTDGYMGYAEQQASAVAQLPEELRRVVWRHAVDLYAYFGKPVEQLSREQIATWLGLRAGFERLADAGDPVDRAVFEAIGDAKRRGFKIVSWKDTTDHPGHDHTPPGVERGPALFESRRTIEIVFLK